MGTALFAWELGGGSGHLMRMAQLAKALADRGHRVYVAVRELSGAPKAFAHGNIFFLQAPFHHRIVAPPYPQPVTYPQIIANISFGDDALLAALAEAWRSLYRLIRPGLIVFDHSPTALLAARGLPCRLALLGTGFCVPPDLHPYPDLRETPELSLEELLAQEERLLDRINRLLRHWNQPPMDRVGRLFSQVHEAFLTTHRELDHYPQRTGAHHWGPVNATGGAPPEWPQAPGKRVFAYLKNFPALPALLEFLAARAVPTLVAVDGIAPALTQRFARATLRFAGRRLDPDLVARSCDVAIVNGNHGMTATLLSAGKPTLQIPLFLEQMIMGRIVRQLGAGLDAPIEDAATAVACLEKLLESGQFESNAQRFASLYRDFDAEGQRIRMADRACELLAEG